MSSGLKRLSARADRDSRRAGRIMRWRLDDRWTSTAKYLYWRNRFPILTKLWLRAVLFLEIFLLYKFFHAGIAASIALLALVLLLLKSIHRGIAQPFRIRIIELQGSAGKFHRINQLYTLMLASSVLFGVLCTGTICIAVHCADMGSVSRFYSIALCLVFPLELAAASAWGTLYLKRRYHRNGWIVFGSYLVPTLSLILFHSVWGPFSYIAGVAFSRLVLSGYLFIHAHKALARAGILLDRSGLAVRRIWNREFRDMELFGHLVAPAAFPMYGIAVATALHLQNKEAWMVHFIFVTLLYTLSYPVVRVVTSLAMDVYLAAKAGEPKIARLIHRKSLRAATFFLTLEAIALTLFMVAVSSYLGMQAHVGYRLAPFLIVLLALRSRIDSWVLIHVTMGTEKYFARRMLAILLSAAAVQLFAILHWRVNLQAVYLIEIVAVAAVLLVMRKTDAVADSPVLTNAVQRAFKTHCIIPPVLAPWLRQQLQNYKIGVNLAVVTLNERYPSAVQQRRLVASICGQLGTNTVNIQLWDRCFLFVSAAALPMPGNEYGRRIKTAAPFHIRDALPVRGLDDLEGCVEHLMKYARGKQLPRTVRHLDEAVKSGIIGTARNLLKQFEKAGIEHRESLRFVRELLTVVDIPIVPRVEFDGERRLILGAASPELTTAAFEILSDGQLRSAVIAAKKSTVFFVTVLGCPICVFDGASLDGAQRTRLNALTLAASLLLSERAALKAESQFEGADAILQTILSALTSPQNESARAERKSSKHFGTSGRETFEGWSADVPRTGTE